MNHFAGLSASFLAVASFSSYHFNSRRQCQTVSAESFQTPEQYLKPMFDVSQSGKAIPSKEPKPRETIMSSQSILDLLSKNAQTVETPGNPFISRYQSNQYNAN